MLVSLVLVGCAGSEPAPEASEFSRRLRLGVEQLRRYLPDSARAEFDRCAEMRPEDPELMFHQARLALMPGAADPDAAIGLLERVVVLRPDSVKAQRLLHELELRRDGASDPARREAILAVYGQLGLFEMASHDAYVTAEASSFLSFVEEQPGLTHLETYRTLRAALLKLNRQGGYDPDAAVPVIERTMRRFPDLALVRLAYAQKLILGEIRISSIDRPDLPPMSSTLIIDMAQYHYEQAFDQVDPGSRLALGSLFMLSHLALLMGDYDEAVAYLDIRMAQPDVPPAFHRFLIGRRGLVRYKQRRFDEAIALLDEALEGTNPRSPAAQPFRWVQHLTYDDAETPPEQPRHGFPLREDFVRPPGPLPFDFEDVAPQYRIDKRDGAGPSAWGDYDRDGDFDLFVTGADSYGALYRNDGTVFTDVSREAGLFQVDSGFSATFIDYDNDGWPDLHIGRNGWNGPMPNALYHNGGDGTFSDVTERAGLADSGSSFVCAWSDVDRDGDIDLMVANGITGGGDTNRLYRNNGDGTFSDDTERAGLAEPSGLKTVGLAFGDGDLDGWPDLFVSGFGTRNRYYRNRGDGTFEEIALEAGLAGDPRPTSGYVSFFVDYDNDLDLDILKTNLAPWRHVLAGLAAPFGSYPAPQREEMLLTCPKLYRNNGDGTFAEVGEQAGLTDPIGIMGAGVADLDNDGWQDLYFGTGDPAIERMEPDRFLRNNGDGTFTDVTFAVGLGNTGKGHGVTFTDVDGDGDLEIYAPEGGFVHGDAWPNAFYLNGQDTGHHWLHLDLVGRKSNRDALDTMLIVHAGEMRLLREVHNGDGFGSSSSPTVEFGLGEARSIDRLEVRWSSGTVQTFDDVPVDRRIVLREGERWVAWSRDADAP
jgi:tetratricopeptide (TPR) repeat protein